MRVSKEEGLDFVGSSRSALLVSAADGDIVSSAPSRSPGVVMVIFDWIVIYSDIPCVEDQITFT